MVDANADLRQILADLSAAHVALRRSSTAFDAAVMGMRGALDGVASSNQAQGEAIDAIVAATERALQLFTSPERH